MGVKLIILLALLIGVLYCIHILVKDYQTLMASRLLRVLFKRDVSSENSSKPNVRWRKILLYDPIQCARLLYCEVGVKPEENELIRGFVFLLGIEPREEDKSAKEHFLKAFLLGRSQGDKGCRDKYFLCPFKPTLLFELVEYLLSHPLKISPVPKVLMNENV